MISYGPGFTSKSLESFKLREILAFKCCKFNSAVNTTSKLTKTVIPKKNYLNTCHHAYSFCLQDVSKKCLFEWCLPPEKVPTL